MSWDNFVESYQNEHLSGLSGATASRAMYPLDALKRAADPKSVADVDLAMLSDVASQWRSSGLSESTIKSNLGHIRAALNWAHSMGWRAKADVPAIKRAKKSTSSAPHKGRPITPREFGRMLKCVPDVVSSPRPWRMLLAGLWLSGLRLDEAIGLTWESGPEMFVTSAGSDRMYLRIHAEDEKGGSDRTYPITPDFERMLLRIRPVDHSGRRVFEIPKQRGAGLVSDKHFVSRVISKIGKRSGVVVNQKTGKFASAHDLRRSFGERWAMRPGITPQILMTLMRHESIETTLRYYALMNAVTVSDALRKSEGNKSGNREGQKNPLSIAIQSESST